MSIKFLKFLFFIKLLNINFAFSENIYNNIESNETKVNLKLNQQINVNNILNKYEILAEHEIKLYQNIINQNILSNLCRKDLNLTLNGILEGKRWATTMYDASVKKPSGIEIGSIYQFGNFDECININDNYDNLNTDYNVKSKYCLADVHLDNYNIDLNISRANKKTNLTIIHWGICIPANCQIDDIKILMSNLLSKNVELNDDQCYVNEPFIITNGMMIYGCIILFFICLTLFSTILHLYFILKDQNKLKTNESNAQAAIKAFSIIENLKKLLQNSHNDHLHLNSLNGIKAVLMLLIIVGHSILFIVGGPVLNSQFFAQEVKKIQNGFLTNSILFVDTFLFLSGFLFCRILLRELEVRQGKINPFLLYIFRYIRLTPAYLVVITFYMTWFPYIGSGPLWKQRIGLEKKRCETSWILNLLYINNYIGTDNLCMFQSWYLSADTQLFILAPIVIFLLYKNRKIGISFLTVVTVVISLIPFLITWLQKLDPTILIIEDEVRDISSNLYFVTSYIKTHMRATAYMFGLFTGFLLHYMSEKGIKIPQSLVVIFWILSGISGILSMFGITWFYINLSTFTILESSLFSGFHRIGWSLSSAWLVIACTTGNAKFLEKILSSRFFAPLSRLTYCAYLTNGVVELYMASSIKAPLQMDHIHVFGYAMSHAWFTFITSIVLCLLFESPIHAMERFFLKRDQQRRSSQVKHITRRGSPSTSEENT